MAKAKTIYACTECGASASKWQGQCPGCGVWNTLVETVEETSASSGKRFAALSGTSRLQVLAEIEARDAQGIIELANNLDLSVIAEGVETREHYQFLLTHGCKAFQGFLFGHPMTLEEFERQACAQGPLPP